jgi:hypothetical protein
MCRKPPGVAPPAPSAMPGEKGVAPPPKPLAPGEAPPDGENCSGAVPGE